MLTIWKYQLEPRDSQELDLPKDAKFLSCQIQHGEVCVWFLCDDRKALGTEKKIFYVRGTGHQAENMNHMKFLGTVQIHGGTLVFHIFMDEI